MPSYSAHTGDDAKGYGEGSCPECASDQSFWLEHRDGIGRPHGQEVWKSPLFIACVLVGLSLFGAALLLGR